MGQVSNNINFVKSYNYNFFEIVKGFVVEHQYQLFHKFLITISGVSVIIVLRAA